MRSLAFLSVTAVLASNSSNSSSSSDATTAPASSNASHAEATTAPASSNASHAEATTAPVSSNASHAEATTAPVSSNASQAAATTVAPTTAAAATTVKPSEATTKEAASNNETTKTTTATVKDTEEEVTEIADVPVAMAAPKAVETNDDLCMGVGKALGKAVYMNFCQLLVEQGSFGTGDDMKLYAECLGNTGSVKTALSAEFDSKFKCGASLKSITVARRLSSVQTNNKFDFKVTVPKSQSTNLAAASPKKVLEKATDTNTAGSASLTDALSSTRMAEQFQTALSVEIASTPALKTALKAENVMTDAELDKAEEAGKIFKKVVDGETVSPADMLTAENALASVPAVANVTGVTDVSSLIVATKVQDIPTAAPAATTTSGASMLGVSALVVLAAGLMM